ncbi:aminotransferase class I/II-fold pyridoxal phosphate-dependent enzyme [Fructilactobacillus sanfranciscensis]|uniref:Aminotransferase n=1 Tax=Fructilactobacillus sanfranciscensis TaxID=1625 RepID=A0A5C4TIF7_FRUSA|nr:aminotransferase class I/II-fold pyridoxal phosphate-dependent enzyme [Fructilactobacillus sanfranciscensis]TNK90163.1 pyridoxal phosphate-dependent aminotransferase [Fructilactobacillus sanfranciscensis]TNK95866.1 pyridoxal phosphate-dependent aminotransferase [Fructilactobacillus sanfranciscensis]TNK97542.1 pyridoxal phosphate-dependent aminotransferase [Fructilactobacillus sanfranciscensis]TNK99007.1 pyridoxal phosphate-dependent aminotransferase [Fructilactobacillus sanfranciscensis]TNL
MHKNLKDKIKPDVLRTQLSNIYGFSEKISKIPDLVKLTLGEPDFATPKHVKQAAIAAIDDDESHYTATWGRIETRKAAADFLKNKYDVDYDPETQLVITNGVTEAMYDSLATFIEEGDEVLVPTPAFPVYYSLIDLNGGKLIQINTQPDDFLLTPERLQKAIAEHPNAKMIILNFPSNPTGRTYSASEIQMIAEILAKTDLIVVSDEIYSELTYGQKHTSIARFIPDQTILFNGLSKSHAMTGWRIGIFAGPANLVEQIAKVHELVTTSVMTAAQVAAEEAFVNGQDDALPMVKQYIKRRDYLHEGLEKLGFKNELPEGAFYIFAKIPADLNQNSYDFCIEVAEKAKVGMIPGSSFGAGGEGYVRLSYATSLDNIKEALNRLQKYLD